jgi:hypothetical protein
MARAEFIWQTPARSRPPSPVASHRGVVVRHLSVGEPCPLDATPVSRTHCSTCPSFISFRSSEGVAVVGCSWGEDIAAWLRSEMGVNRTRPARPTRPTRPRAPKRRQRFAPGPSFGLFLAALGVGIALSALEPAD